MVLTSKYFYPVNNKNTLNQGISLLMGAIVEDVRTGFEKRGDVSVVIPEIKENVLM